MSTEKSADFIHNTFGHSLDFLKQCSFKGRRLIAIMMIVYTDAFFIPPENEK